MKRGQAWGFDLMIASGIFLAGIIFFYFYAINYSQDNSLKSDNLAYEASLIADTIFSEGYPEDWNSEDVLKIGIIEENKVSPEKAYNFYILANEDYERTKNLFNTRYEYYLSFPENLTYNSTEIDLIGFKNEEAENIAKISRTTILNNKIQSIDIIVWE